MDITKEQEAHIIDLLKEDDIPKKIYIAGVRDERNRILKILRKAVDDCINKEHEINIKYRGEDQAGQDEQYAMADAFREAIKVVFGVRCDKCGEFADYVDWYSSTYGLCKDCISPSEDMAFWHKVVDMK